MKFVAIFLSWILLLSAAGCSTAPDVSSNDSTPLSSSSSSIEESGPPELKLEETAVADGLYELTIHKVGFTFDVLPDTMSALYTHYEADTDKIYLDIDVSIKNLQKSSVMCDSIATITLDYNDGYTYTAFPVVEDRQTGFTYANITAIDPLETMDMRFLVDCPQELYLSDAPLFLLISFADKEFKMQLTDENGNYDILTPNTPELSQAQLDAINEAFSQVGLEAQEFRNSRPISTEGTDNADIINFLSGCQAYDVLANDGSVYRVIFSVGENMVVTIYDENVNMIFDNMEQAVTSYFNGSAASTDSYYSVPTPPSQVNLWDEEVIWSYDAASGN